MIKWLDGWINLLQRCQKRVSLSVNIKPLDKIEHSFFLFFTRVKYLHVQILSLVHTTKKDKWKQYFLFLPLSYFWPQKLSQWSINIVNFFLHSKWQDCYFWNKFYLFCYRHNEWLKDSVLEITKPLSKNIGDLKVDLLW